jgi:acetyl-CoA carboxylase carboxyltransferase component
VAHYRAADDQACLDRIRRIVSALPRKPRKTTWTTPLASSRQLRPSAADKNNGQRVDLNYREETRDLLRVLLDQGRLEEFQPDCTTWMITGYAHIAGIPVGLIADQRPTVCVETDKSSHPEAAIFVDTAEKLAAFIEECNRCAIPILFLHDGSRSGWSIEDDWQSIRASTRFIDAMASANVPRIVLALNNTSEADFFTMVARVFEPDFVFTLPTAPVQNAIADNGQWVDASQAAARGFVDAVITPEEIRQVLEFALLTALNNPRRFPGSFVFPEKLV